MNRRYFAKCILQEGEMKEVVVGSLIEVPLWLGSGPNIVTKIEGDIAFVNGCKDIYDETEGTGYFTISLKDHYNIIGKSKLCLCSRDNPEYAQEILTKGIKEGQEFTESEKDLLTLCSVVEIYLAD